MDLKRLFLYVFSNLPKILSNLSFRNILILIRALRGESILNIWSNLNRKLQKGSPTIKNIAVGDSKVKMVLTEFGIIQGGLLRIYGNLENASTLEKVIISGEEFDPVTIFISKDDSKEIHENIFLLRDELPKAVQFNFHTATGSFSEILDLYPTAGYDVLNKEQAYHISTKIEAAEIVQLPVNEAKNPSYTFVILADTVNKLTPLLDSINTQTYKKHDVVIISSRELTHGKSELDIIQDRKVPVHLMETGGNEKAHNRSNFRDIQNCRLPAFSGDYLVILKSSGIFHKNFLHCCNNLLSQHSKLDLIYTNEDSIDEMGKRYDPIYKPELNVDLLLSYNYLGNVIVAKRDTIRRNHLQSPYIDFYTQVFKLLKKGNSIAIANIPYVLYHNFKRINKNNNTHSDLRVVKQFYKEAPAINVVSKGIYRELNYPRQYKEKVSIIIPFKNQIDLLKACVDSVIQKTKHENYELLLVDNNSDEPATLEFLNLLDQQYDFVTVIKDKQKFNYSRINNQAAKAAQGDKLLFLNNDTEIITDGWLSEMLSYAHQSRIGAVGAMLLYEDDTIQHEGVYLSYNRSDRSSPRVDHINKMARVDDRSGFFPGLVKNPRAVTAACLMVDKEKFLSVRGFDEESLRVAYNDVDFCLKLEEGGYQNVVLPSVKVYHFESKSRGANDTYYKKLKEDKEFRFFYKKWQHKFTRNGEMYGI